MRIKAMGDLLVILLILTARVEASTVSFNPSGTSVGIGNTFTISHKIAWMRFCPNDSGLSHRNSDRSMYGRL